MAAFLLPIAGAALGLGAIDKATGGYLGVADAIGTVFDEVTGVAEGKREEDLMKLKMKSEADRRSDDLRLTIEDRKAAREEKAEEARLAREANLEDRKAQREADERKDALAREERAFLMATASAKEAKDAAIAAAAQQRQDQLKRDELNSKIVAESRAAALERFRATKIDFPKLRAVPELDEEAEQPIKKKAPSPDIPQALFSEYAEELGTAGLLGAGKVLYDKYKAIKGGKLGALASIRRGGVFADDELESRARERTAKKIVQESQETTNILHPFGGYRNIPVAQHVTQDPGFTMKMPRRREELN